VELLSPVHATPRFYSPGGRESPIQIETGPTEQLHWKR